MRISSRMFTDSALRSVRAGQEQLNRLQEQVTTGKRIRKVSDDPIEATQVMHMQSTLRQLSQYQRNATEAATRLNTEDVTITTARDLLQKARDLAIGVQGMDRFSPDRQAAITAIEQLRQQLVSLGNTRLGSEYIFGGGQTASPPFLRDGTYVGDDTVRQVEIEDGLLVTTNHPGSAFFEGALAGMAELERSLTAGTDLQVQNAIVGLETAEDGMIRAQAESGATLQQIQATSESLATRIASLADQRDALGNADPAAASVELLAAQSALERAYSAIGKVLSTNLLDYLR